MRRWPPPSPPSSTPPPRPPRPPSRLAKRDAIAALLRGAAPDEVEIAVAWLSGEIRQGRIGVGWSALSTLRGREPAPTPSLTLREVDAAFADVAATAGKGSAAARSAKLQALFARATAAEQDFLVRLLVGELRQGALEGVMLDAIAAASGLPAADVRRAAMLTGSLRETARVALGEDGAAALARFAVALHRPVQPMLATPADDIASAMAKLGTAALEWKVDGARVQVHKAGRRGQGLHPRAEGRDRLGARDRRGPAGAAGRGAHPRRRGHRPRGRRHAAALPGDDAPLRPQARRRSDARRAAARGLLLRLPAPRRQRRCSTAPAQERFDALAAALPPALVIPRIVTADVAAAEDFYADALARGHEGVMAKALDAPYEAGRRGASWLKVKRAHTLDLVVLAAEWGHGRQKGLALEPAPRRARPGRHGLARAAG